MMAEWIMHRHPAYWSDPDRFIPERWLAEGDRPKLAYFPFGAGPRVCIGERFAWMEGMLVLAAMGSRWQFRLRNPHAEPRMEPSLTLRPKGGLGMVACEAPSASPQLARTFTAASSRGSSGRRSSAVPPKRLRDTAAVPNSLGAMHIALQPDTNSRRHRRNPDPGLVTGAA